MQPMTRYRLTWAGIVAPQYVGVFRQFKNLTPVAPISQPWWQFEDGLIVNPAHVSNIEPLED